MFGHDAIKYSEIRIGSAAGFGFAGYAFTEAIQAARAAARVEFTDRSDGVVERFARNKTASHAAACAIVHDKMRHPGTARKFEQNRAKHQQRLRRRALKDQTSGG